MEQLGKYQIVRRLAAGGMAELFLGKQSGLEGFEKTVVIKRLHSSLASRKDLVEMFLNEARIAARLNHPNCVQIYDLGQADGQYFIAMEYIHGPDMMALQRAAKKRKMPLPAPIACTIMAAVCRGLHHAHELRDHTTGKRLQLVHRDVSPHNVLVTYSGDVKLVDFGVAKANTLAAATQAGVLKGKFAYMSPEQCRGDPLDARSDIFAAGILLHELITRRRLFRRNSDFATMRAVLEDPIPHPSAVAKELPAAIEAVILRALARDREERYQNAQQMQRELEEAMRANNWRVGDLELADCISRLFPDQDALPAEDSLNDADNTNAASDAPAKPPALAPSGSLLGGLGRAPGAPASGLTAPLPSLGGDSGEPPREPATMIEPASAAEPKRPTPPELIVSPPAPQPLSGPAPQLAPEPPTALEERDVATSLEPKPAPRPLPEPPALPAPPARKPAPATSPKPASAAIPKPAPAAIPRPAPAAIPRPAPAAIPRPAPAAIPRPAPSVSTPAPAPALGAAFAPEGMLGTMLEDEADVGESTVMTSSPPAGLSFDVGDESSLDAEAAMPMTATSPFAEPQALAPAPAPSYEGLDDLGDEDEATVAGPAPAGFGLGQPNSLRLPPAHPHLDVAVTSGPGEVEPEELATTPLLTPAGPAPGFYPDEKTPATQRVAVHSGRDKRPTQPNDPASYAKPITPSDSVLREAEERALRNQDRGTDPALPAVSAPLAQAGYDAAFDDKTATLLTLDDEADAALAASPTPRDPREQALAVAPPAPSDGGDDHDVATVLELSGTQGQTATVAPPAPIAAPPPVQPTPMASPQLARPPAGQQPAAPPVPAPTPEALAPTLPIPAVPATPATPAPAPPQPTAPQPAPAAAKQHGPEAFAPTIAPGAHPPALGPPPAVGDVVDQRHVPTQAVSIIPEPRARRSLLPWIIGGLALVFVGLAVMLALMLGGRGASAKETSLRVTSNPAGARIFIDGKEAYGVTPVTVHAVTSDKKLWVVAMKKGYKAAKRQVTVPKGKRLPIDFSLVAEGGRPEGRGTLRIVSAPTGADVYVDGTRRGVTPLLLKSVTTDQKHVIVVRKEGYEDGVENIFVKPKEEKKLNLELKVAPEKPRPTKRKAPARDDKPLVIPRGRRAGLRDKTETVVPK